MVRPKQLLIATTNRNKFQEMKLEFLPTSIELISLNEIAQLRNPHPEKVRPPIQWNAEGEVVENGSSFLENAQLKAQGYGSYWDIPTLADDSGLCVPALDLSPGVYSARYAGENATDQDNIQKILQQIRAKDLTNPTAYFACVLAWFDPTRNPPSQHHVEGRLDGYLVETQQGSYGFGYDPIFYVPHEHKTVAEMLPEEKNRISHRGQATKKMVHFFSSLPLL